MKTQLTIFLIIAGTATSNAIAQGCPGNSDLYSPDQFQPNFNPWHPDADLDNDGIINSEDDDMDGDGIKNGCDPVQDRCTDGTVGNPYWCDTCWWLPCLQSETQYPRSGGGVRPDEDPDGDGDPNSIDTDDDNDGCPDVNDPDNPDYDPTHPDSDPDGDGDPNILDLDDDGDGCPDECDTNPCDPGEGGGEDCPCEDDNNNNNEPGDREDDPEPDPRPDNDNPDDRPEPPSPGNRDDVPDVPSDPEPPTPPDPPEDDPCCIAITSRLDNLLLYADDNSQMNRIINVQLSNLNEWMRQLYDGLLVGDGNSFLTTFQNQLDDVNDFLAQNQAFTREDLEYQFDQTWYLQQIYNEGLEVDLGEYDNHHTYEYQQFNDSTSAIQRLQIDHKTAISEAGQNFTLPDIESFSDDEAPAVWTLNMAFMSTFGIQMTPITVDFTPYSALRGIVHTVIYIMVTLNSIFIVWAELKKQ